MGLTATFMLGIQSMALHAGRCARHAKPGQRFNSEASLYAKGHGLAISGHMVGSFQGYGYDRNKKSSQFQSSGQTICAR